MEMGSSWMRDNRKGALRSLAGQFVNSKTRFLNQPRRVASDHGAPGLPPASAWQAPLRQPAHDRRQPTRQATQAALLGDPVGLGCLRRRQALFDAGEEGTFLQ